MATATITKEVTTTTTTPVTKKNIFSLIAQYARLRFAKFAKRFDLEQINYENLPIEQKKAVDIASVCIFNKKSKLYYNRKDGFIQIELPEVFITVTEQSGFYEVNFVYVGQPIATLDSVRFDSTTINHIYNKFEREVEVRMEDNLKIKDVVFNSHLDVLSIAVKKLSE